MKKHVMLGINSITNECCILFCLLPFNILIPSEIESSDFTSQATNWGGRDEIERTLDIINMKQTGKKIYLDKKIKFEGADSDMGHTYPWKFEIDEIHELGGLENYE